MREKNEREKRASAELFLLRRSLCSRHKCVSFANLKEPLNGGGACTLCEILKLRLTPPTPNAAASAAPARKEEEELVLRCFQRISRKSFRSLCHAAKSCASRKIFTSALALSLSCHFSFAGCSGARAFQEHSRTVRNFIDLGDFEELHAKSLILSNEGFFWVQVSLYKQAGKRRRYGLVFMGFAKIIPVLLKKL